MKAAVGEDVYIQEQLIDEIVTYLDFTEAARWARFFKLNDSQVPSQVVPLLHEEDPPYRYETKQYFLAN